jgi:glycosyltransferase involved in cell wall biosynthesis
MLGMPAIIASKITATPCICHLRETRELIRREKFILKWVYKFIILNKDAYEVYKKYIPESKLRIVVNGLNLDNFLAKENNKFKKEFNFDTHTLIGVIGRIVKGKGQKEFVLASKKVLQVKPEIGFAIVGDAKGTNSNYYYEEVRTLVKKENLEKNVIFTGWRDDIKNVLAGLDILVLPSTTFPEGLPNSIIEAMALSKPVIATDIPGPRDIVVDGVTGFLVPPGDTKAMAEKIIYLLDNPEIAKKMGEEGRKRVEELFDIKKQVKKIEQVYEEVLSGK